MLLLTWTQSLNDLLCCLSWKFPGMWGAKKDGIKLCHDRAQCSWHKTVFALFLMQLSPSSQGIYLTFAHICWPHTPQWTIESQICHLFLFVVTHLLHMGSFQLLRSVFVVFSFPLHGMKIPHLRKHVALSTKACFLIPSKRCWMVFFICTFWCDKDRLPHCISGRLRARSGLLC